MGAIERRTAARGGASRRRSCRRRAVEITLVLLLALAAPVAHASADPLPGPRPDLLVGHAEGSLQGDDVYGGGQIIRRRAVPAGERGFRIVLENDGAATGPMSLVAFPSSRALRFRVYREGLSIARTLVGRTFSADIQPGERLELQVVIRAPRWSERGDWYGVTFTATSPDLPGVLDVATLAATVKR